MSNFKPYYIYLHKNGSWIKKPKIVVESAGGPEIYFEGDMVIQYFYIDSEKREKYIGELNEYN